MSVRSIMILNIRLSSLENVCSMPKLSCKSIVMHLVGPQHASTSVMSMFLSVFLNTDSVSLVLFTDALTKEI